MADPVSDQPVSDPPVRAEPSERRSHSRTRVQHVWDPLYGGLRAVLAHVSGFYAAVGVFLLAGAVVAVGATWAFAEIAGEVREGTTQALDEALMHWVVTQHRPWLTLVMFHLTLLGTGTVVMMTVGISAIFLWLTRHRHSAVLLLAATSGGLVLNSILKIDFQRPRPQVFPWETEVFSSSFPSGHAMSAAIVYSTVAYLASRLQERRWSRWLTMVGAVTLVVLIGASRVYLGVHYPSDVVAGVLVGLAWAAFCMATLEATQLLAARRAPAALANEAPAARDEAEQQKS